jgi:2-polyprenyl-3-methyl-5-hydroxy-6-metoxy-1,4-benzoquinol methylase
MQDEISINRTRFVFSELRNPEAVRSQFSAQQRQSISEYNQRVSSDPTKTEWCSCLCGNADSFDLIATTDRYGFDQQSVLCKTCGLIFANPRMTPDEAAYFYQSDIYRKIYGGEDYLKALEEKYDSSDQPLEILSHIQKKVHIGPKTTVTELGAGGGWNLIPFKKLGATVSGIEHSPTLVELGNRRELNLTAGSLEVLKGRYDLILINHVLEHTHDPVRVLAKLKTHLKPNGTIYVGVPNILCFDISQFQNAHLYYFSPKNFHYFCNKAGLDVVQSGSARGFHMYAMLTAKDDNSSSLPLSECSKEVYSLLKKQKMRRKIGGFLRTLGLKS